MSEHPTTPEEDALVARLLRGDPDPADRPEDAALAGVLVALLAPPRVEDLVGREEALAAFVAHHAEDRDRSRAPASRRAARRWLGVPVAVVVAGGLVATGGVAAAAWTGSLPRPLQELAHDVVGAPAPGRPADRPGDPPTDGDRTPVPSPSAPVAPGSISPTSPAGGPTPTPSGTAVGVMPGATTPTSSAPGTTAPGAPAPAGTTGPGSGSTQAPSSPATSPPSPPRPPHPLPLPTVTLPPLPVPLPSIPKRPLPPLPTIPVPTLPLPPLPLPTLPTLPLPTLPVGG